MTMTIGNSERARSSTSDSRMMHGGYSDARPLTVVQRDHLDALIDTLIPPEEGWPSSSSLTVADVVARYLAPDSDVVIHYPNYTYEEFTGLLLRIAAPLVDEDMDTRVRRLQRVELDEFATFTRLRDFLYYSYYGCPDVVQLIRARTRFGSDFHGRPQPAGYAGALETWADRKFTTKGAFFSTESVRRVPNAAKDAQ